MKLKRILITSISICIVSALTLYIAVGTYVYAKLHIDTRKKADAIIILGSGVLDNHGKYNACLISRVNQGVALYKQGYASKIIMSGGTDIESDLNEALMMKKWAVEAGVQEKDVFMENKSTSTYENLKYSKDLMNNNNINTAIIVTENFHIARADLVATHLGIFHYVAPVQDSNCWSRWKVLSKYFLVEPLGIVLYKLQGKI